MRKVLLAVLASAASVRAPPGVDIRVFFSDVEKKMSAGATNIAGATKSIIKEKLQPRLQVAGSSAVPLRAGTAASATAPPPPGSPGTIACRLVRMVGTPPALRFSNYAKNIGTTAWGIPEGPGDKYRDDCANRSPIVGPYRFVEETRPGKGKGYWRRDKGPGTDTTKTERNHNGLAKRGETRKSAEIRQAAAHGKTPAQARHEREQSFLQKYGFARHPSRQSRDGFGNLAAAHTMLQKKHINEARWAGEYTEADGAGHSLEDAKYRSEITGTFYSWYNPPRPPSTRNGNSLRTAVSAVQTCRPMAGVDLEFNQIGQERDGDLDEDGRSVWARIYDFSIAVHDCHGKVDLALSWHSRNDNHTPLSEETRQEGINWLKKLDTMSILIYSWGNPELAVFEKAGLRQADGSTGFDMRQALLSVIKECKPSALKYPFSLSQNVLVPFLGVRSGPYHKAKQDTYDEALTVTALLWGLVEFWKS